MPDFFTQFACRAMLVACLLIGPATVGCQSWAGGPLLDRLSGKTAPDDTPEAESPKSDTPKSDTPEAEAEPTETAATGDMAVLETDGWIRAIQPAGGASPDKPTRRWRHPGLEDLLSRPAERLPPLAPVLADKNPVAAANAAIALARLGDGSGSEQLAATVRAPGLKMPIRCAAAEALATLRQPAAEKLIGELLDQYGQSGKNGLPSAGPELHAELIRGLARRAEPSDRPRLLDALRSADTNVRLAAVEAWSADGQKGLLPIELVDLRAATDPRLRAAVLRILAQQQHPDSHKYLSAALADRDIRVRIAAIGALGELGGDQARADLERMLKDRAELIRVAAVAALDKVGARRAVSDTASDKSWRVRLAVAKTLGRHSDRAASDLARQLLDDPSPAVQQQALAAMADWPLQRAGPILLGAMDTTAYSTRMAAARQLADRWQPARQFPTEGPKERRTEVLEELHNQFRQQHGFVDPAALVSKNSTSAKRPIPDQRIEQLQRLLRPLGNPAASEAEQRQAVEALRAFGPDLTRALEQLALVHKRPLPEAVYQEVLSGRDPAFAALTRLASDDALARRRAAAELATLTAERTLCRLAVERLARLMVRETDQLVWKSVLEAVATDPTDPASRLAYTAIGHSSPEIRRRACDHLAAHPDPRHAAVLLPALEDPSNPVVEAAVVALGAAGRLDDTEPIRQLLADNDQLLRVAAAVALVRLGERSGVAALERLAYSPDAIVRRRTARAMGDLAEPAFVPTLIRMLDDRDDVRRAALANLPKVAGPEAVKAPDQPPANTADRVESWKRWFRQQRAAARRVR